MTTLIRYEKNCLYQTFFIWQKNFICGSNSKVEKKNVQRPFLCLYKKLTCVHTQREAPISQLRFRKNIWISRFSFQYSRTKLDKKTKLLTKDNITYIMQYNRNCLIIKPNDKCRVALILNWETIIFAQKKFFLLYSEVNFCNEKPLIFGCSAKADICILWVFFLRKQWKN